MPTPNSQPCQAGATNQATTPILAVVKWLARESRYLTPQWPLHVMLRRICPWARDLIDRADLTDAELEPSVVWRRARAIDWYVMSWLAVELTLFLPGLVARVRYTAIHFESGVG
jgi:hypothetical protein